MERRSTKQQRAIEAALRDAARPLSPGEILDLAQKAVPTLSQATVYRAVARMVEEEEASMVELPGQPPRYELAHAAAHHHHHFCCTKCDKVYDLHGCAKGVDDLAPEGFAVDRHEITLFGVCADCA